MALMPFLDFWLSRIQRRFIAFFVLLRECLVMIDLATFCVVLHMFANSLIQGSSSESGGGGGGIWTRVCGASV